MANFCSKCGRPLEDGEVCNCTNETNQTAVQQDVTVNQQTTQNEQSMYSQVTPNQQTNYSQGTPTEQPNYSQGTPTGQPNYSQGTPNRQSSQFSQQMAGAANVAGDYAKNIWKVLVDIWKAPADNLKTFVDEKNFNHSLGFIGAQIILIVLLTCLMIRKVYSSIMGLFGGFSSLFSLGFGNVKIPYFKVILSTIIITAICACLFALIAMLVVKTYVKVEMSFKKGLCIYAANCAAQLPFLVVAVVFSVFSIGLSAVVIAIGGILGYFYVHTALDNGQNANKRVYTSFLVFACNLVATLILFWLYIKIL